MIPSFGQRLYEIHFLASSGRWDGPSCHAWMVVGPSEADLGGLLQWARKNGEKVDRLLSEIGKHEKTMNSAGKQSDAHWIFHGYVTYGRTT